MKVYIHTDIEGVAGYVFYQDRTNPSYANQNHIQRMNQLLTNEVVAACNAALDSGADEVWVNDAHGPCHSILFEQLPSKCQIINGRPGYFDQWLAQIDKAKFDALVCIGQHAMAGTAGSVCPHSLWHLSAGDKQLKLSETSMAAALAGYYDIPCVAVSGDNKICQEMGDKIFGINQIVVKHAIAAQNARSLCPKDACARIYQGVKESLSLPEYPKPYKPTGPYKLNISDRDPNIKILDEDVIGEDFNQTVLSALNRAGSHYGEDPIDDRSFRWPQ